MCFVYSSVTSLLEEMDKRMCNISCQLCKRIEGLNGQNKELTKRLKERDYKYIILPIHIGTNGLPDTYVHIYVHCLVIHIRQTMSVHTYVCMYVCM